MRLDSGAVQPLTPQDASFVRLDRLQLPMQVAVLAIFEGGTWLDGGAFDLQRLRGYLGSRLGDVPEFHSRLGFAPKTGEPTWSRVAALDLEEHVQVLPPGSTLEARVDSFLSYRLNHGSPLWEIGVIPDLPAANSFGLVWKVHHALVDGIAGIEFLRGVFQPKNGAPVSDREVSGRRAERNLAGEAVNGGNGFARPQRLNLRAVAEGLTRTTATPLSKPVRGNLTSQWFAIERKELRLIRQRTGAKSTAILLTAVTGALRELVLEWRLDPSEMRLRAEVPVATRRRRGNGELGNRLGIMLIPLPVWEKTPGRRLAFIDAELERRDREGWHVDFEVLARMLARAPSLMLGLYEKIMTHIRPHNFVFSSIPGPLGPLTLEDAALTDLYPLIPPLHGHALGLATISYRGRIHWGIRSALPNPADADRLKAGIAESLIELR